MICKSYLKSHEFEFLSWLILQSYPDCESLKDKYNNYESEGQRNLNLCSCFSYGFDSPLNELLKVINKSAEPLTALLVHSPALSQINRYRIALLTKHSRVNIHKRDRV